MFASEIEYAVAIPAIFAAAVIVSLLVRSIKIPSTTFDLQHFRMKAATAALQQPLVEIFGRQQDILSQLLNVLGLQYETRFTVNQNGITCETHKLSGHQKEHIALNHVAKYSAKSEKNLQLIVWAVFITIFGYYTTARFDSWTAFGISLVLAAVLILIFTARSKLVLEIRSDDASSIAIRFAAKNVERIQVDYQRLLMVTELISDLIQSQPEPAPQISTPISTAAQVQPVSKETATASWTTQKMQIEAVAYELFTDARRFAQAGETQEALSVMRDIMERFPTTHAAELAQHGLEKANRDLQVEA